MIRYRPYNRRVRGTVERSHRVLKRKITYDITTQKKVGVNWAENLSQYIKYLNKKKKEAIGQNSTFDLIKKSLDAQDDMFYEEADKLPKILDYQKQHEQNVKVQELNQKLQTKE